MRSSTGCVDVFASPAVTFLLPGAPVGVVAPEVQACANPSLPPISIPSYLGDATLTGVPFTLGGMYSAACAAAASVRCRSPLDEESREWLRCLAVLTERERALARLHQLLLRAARAELRRRSLPAIVEGQQQDDLAHQAADDALLAITSKLDRFRGEKPLRAVGRQVRHAGGVGEAWPPLLA